MTAAIASPSELREAAIASKAWPFEEARRVMKRLGDGAPAKGYALFETGYGPSGLPHIGTFNEVLRTTHLFADDEMRERCRAYRVGQQVGRGGRGA